MPDSQSQAYAASLFEKAQGEIRTMAQIDSQIADLLSQRRASQHELANVQSQINEEFGRLMRESDELPAKILSEISGSPTPEPRAPESSRRQKVTEPVAG